MCIRDRRRSNLKSYLTPKVESSLKPSNHDTNQFFFTLTASMGYDPQKTEWIIDHRTAQRSKCPSRFLEIDPEMWHTRFACPAKPLNVFFLPETRNPLRLKYPPKNTKTHISGETWKNNWLTVRLGDIKRACKTSGATAYLSKTAWALDTEWIWGDRLV